MMTNNSSSMKTNYYYVFPALRIVPLLLLLLVVFVVFSIASIREVNVLSWSVGRHKKQAAVTISRSSPHSTRQQSETTVLVKSKGETTTTSTTIVRSKADDDEYRHQHAGKTKTIPVEPSDYIYQDVWSAPIVIESHKLVFFQVAKVGTSMWKRLFRRMMGEPDWHDAMPHDPNTNGLKFLNQYSLQEATYMMNSPDYTRAIFVRDPKDRLLSAFLDKIDNKHHFAKSSNCCPHHDDDDDDDDKCLDRFQTFSGFVEILNQCNNDCCVSNNHWRPQASRLDEKFYPTIDFVGHIETAHDDAKRLLQRIGAWEEFGKSGWGQYGNESFLERNSDVRHNTNAPDHRAQYYTPELERIVENMYAADYSVFDLPNNNTIKYQDSFSTTATTEDLESEQSTKDGTWCPFAKCTDSPLCRPCQKRYLLIIATGRSGSTTMLDMLNMLPGVRLSGENNNALYHMSQMLDEVTGSANFRRGEPGTAWGHYPIRDSDFACTAQTMMESINPPPQRIQTDSALLRLDRERTIVGFKTIRFEKRWDVAKAVEFVRKHFPCSRVIVNLNSNTTKQAKSREDLGWAKKISDPAFIAEQNELLQQTHSLFGPTQSFLMDTSIYSNNPQRAIDRVNELIRWLGFQNCAFPTLPHANNGQSFLPSSETIQLGSDCHYEGDWTSM